MCLIKSHKRRLMVNRFAVISLVNALSFVELIGAVVSSQMEPWFWVGNQDSIWVGDEVMSVLGTILCTASLDLNVILQN